MREQPRSDFPGVPDPPKPGLEPAFEPFVDTGRQGLLRRLLAVVRHGYGLAAGGAAARLSGLGRAERRRPGVLLLRALVAIAALPVDRSLRRRPFPVQLRCRLERLGPTYIKLGQILSMREDLLPRAITGELREHLLDRLPAVPHPVFLEEVERNLGRPVGEVFAHVRSVPSGSASIGQTHRATLLDGTQVMLKLVKPGIRKTLRRDTRLLRMLGAVLQLVFPRYHPRRVIDEFCTYTLREADLRLEADNAETFAAAFHDDPDIVFPRVWREYGNENLLCMEFLDGIQPGDPRARALREKDRWRLVELGAEAIVRMLYRDGFFHADLHPANLLILPGPKCGFVDLGMVGRFDPDLKRTLLYYFHTLVIRDPDTAASYLTSIAHADRGADPVGFRRDVADICRQWSHRSRFDEFSLGRLILESLSRAAHHRLYFPVEMVLMVKAIVTFEAVGHMLVPGFDVAEVSTGPVRRVLLERFDPLRLAREGVAGLPELADALAKTPKLISEGLQLIEQTMHRPASNPFAGMRATLFGGACVVAGAILLAFGFPWPAGAALLIAGALLAARRGG